MVLRTSEEFKESLRDGRELYILGERVQDITAHPILCITVAHSASIFDIAEEPAVRELFTCLSPDSGQTISRYFETPRSKEDLLRRNLLIEECTRRCRSTFNIVKTVGTDALFALQTIASRMDMEVGTEYLQNVKKFHNHCQESDLTIALAQTDVKGDRSLRPHEESDPDVYVRIVAKSEEGIVVRGAKAHTTAAPVSNEIIVIPTRAMSEKDADYALAFAIPTATPGLKMIARPTGSVAQSSFDFPISRHNIETETVTIFDDVFVPWQRVFMCGEWKYAGALATMFANFHRFTAISYKPPLGDLFVGAAQLIAEYNGVARASHIREKVARLIEYTEMTRACAKVAALDCQLHPSGIAVPNVVMTNVGKFHFASQFHEAVKLLQDIAGGLVITAPSERDLLNPATSAYVDKYLAGVKGTSTSDRLKIFNLIRDLTASDFGGYNLVVSLHGEGSMEAQLISMYRDYNLERCKSLVKQAADIER
ncbi:MAG: 4-hydroxyphenylacetate 3-hydroxylase family protein [Candidatus Bathyarchaeia archaeon]